MPKYKKTVDLVDIDRFMGKWYVIASRPTFLEEGAHNAIETYTWNNKKPRPTGRCNPSGPSNLTT